MKEKLSNVWSVNCSFGEAGFDEIFGFRADCYILMKIDRVVENIDQFFLDFDVKWICFIEHEVKDDSDGPNVNCLIVLVSHQNFRT